MPRRALKTLKRRWRTIRKISSPDTRRQKLATPKLGPVPEISPADKVPDDLSTHVDFLHPWGSHELDLGVLITMFFTFFLATIIAPRSQDV
jgi:hypothetical protein